MSVITLGIYLFAMAFHYKDELVNKARINKVTKIVVSALSVLLILLIYQDMFNGFGTSLLQTSGSLMERLLLVQELPVLPGILPWRE